MRILVAIANHGTKNRRYLDRLLGEYRAMPYDVQIVVLSDTAKDLGSDVEVRVGAPTDDPWSLPFGHKTLFAERQDDYDLFIYSEDDTLITQRHVEGFLEATETLPEDKIAGFLRFEEDEQGHRFCCSMHSHYHWRPGSLCRYGAHAYAYFTNMHSACYALTRSQLKRCIASGGFLVPPHQGYYDLLCTAATDPYTQCGLEKVICISRVEDFLLHHLPNQYLGKMGLPFAEMHVQIDRIIELGDQTEPVGLIPEYTGLSTWRFEKQYYGRADEEVFKLVPSTATKVLSVGCGQGETERRLIESGRTVDAIPLDTYTGVLAEVRGVRCLPANWESLRAMPGETRYDVILVSDLLSYVDDPVRVLQACRSHVAPSGVLLLDFINRRCPRCHRLMDAARQETAQYQFCDRAMIKRWFEASGWQVAAVQPKLSSKRATLNRLLLGLLRDRLSVRISVAAFPQ